jgi:hypothetical protein
MMTFWEIAGNAASIAGLVSFPAAAVACIPIYLGWGHKLILAKKTIVSVLLVIGFVGYIFDLNARFGWVPIEPDVYEEYKPIFSANPQLGKPISQVIRQQHVYEAIYDHAIVLWIETLHSHYAYATDDETRKSIIQVDKDWDLDARLYDEDYLRRAFRPPVGKLAPRGGMARYWIEQPANWKWVGWRKWDCNLMTANYQEFEHGIIIGPVNATRYDDHKSEIIAFTRGGELSIRSSPVLETKCIR